MSQTPDNDNVQQGLEAASPLPPGGQLPSLAMAMMPKSYQEAMHFCTQLSRSSIAPKGMQNDALAIFVCIETGQRMGYGILQSLQNIAVINGKPSIYGDELLARVMRSSVYEHIEEECDGETAICRVKRRGHKLVERTYTLAQAKQAGLLGKAGPWQQYTKRMLQLKARNHALRDLFPDVLGGIVCREEQEEEVRHAVTREPAVRPNPEMVVDAAPSAAAKEAAPTDRVALDAFLMAVDMAQTDAELESVSALGKRLPDGLAQEGRAAFVAKRRTISTPKKPSKTDQLLAQVHTAKNDPDVLPPLDP